MLLCGAHFSGKSAINEHPNYDCSFIKIFSKVPTDFFKSNFI